MKKFTGGFTIDAKKTRKLVIPAKNRYISGWDGIIQVPDTPVFTMNDSKYLTPLC